MTAEKKSIAQVFSTLADSLETGSSLERIPVGLTIPGSEHGETELIKAAQLATRSYPDLEIVLIGGPETEGFRRYEADSLEAAHAQMEALFKAGEIRAAVTMHYTFPLGVTTIGKVMTPARGKEMYIASTTGTADSDSSAAMVLNTVAGIAVAKANGIAEPTVGLLNIGGVAAVEKTLLKLKQAGYPISFTESQRADGGVRMRGNDLLQGTPDIMVCDSLTGNLLMKMFSSFLTGGDYEATGFGYGPCVGRAAENTVAIVSRASGAPVIAAALSFAAKTVRGELRAKYEQELQCAEKAGLSALLSGIKTAKSTAQEPITAVQPPKKVVTEEIHGIDVIDIEQACASLWKAGIYAETGMGCTGPVILTASEDLKAAHSILQKGDYM